MTDLHDTVIELTRRVGDLEVQVNKVNFMECWAVIELMGKAFHAGHVTLVNIHGVNLFRVRPYRGGTERTTVYYSPAAIYCITPVSEEEAKNHVPAYYGERVCRECGCTDDHACIGADGSPCHWVEYNLCSACAEKMDNKE